MTTNSSMTVLMAEAEARLVTRRIQSALDRLATDWAELVDLVADAHSRRADLALEFKVGARSLRGIFEEMITPVLFVVPDRPEVKKVTIRSLFEEAVFS